MGGGGGPKKVEVRSRKISSVASSTNGQQGIRTMRNRTMRQKEKSDMDGIITERERVEKKR